MTNRVFVGRYQVTEKIGTGGMAEVYKATDKVLGRTVAVKTMLPQYASDTTFAARFRQEAQAAANLSSPYIVNIYDWGKDQDTYFIVMEYIRGIDLKSAIRQRGAINQRKAAEIGVQVCQALSVAHDYDIIHRDVKPQNIMIQPDGNAKVMDFGIARSGNSELTSTNSVLGTAHYVSPEQAQGNPLGPQSDLYSLGIVLYECVTGKLPFEGPDAVSVAVKQVREQPEPPSAINPEVDPTLEAIIMHALNKDPLDRFANARDMRSALANWLAGRPVRLTSSREDQDATELVPTAFTSQATKVVDNRQGVAAGMDTTRVISQPSEDEQEKYDKYMEDESEQPKKKKTVPIIIAILAALLIAAGIFFAVRGCSGDETTSVPDVTGMTLTEAKATLTSSGYTVGTVSEQNSATVAKGNVISQSPKGGSKASEGSSVSLVVSLGAATKSTSVPDLTNLSEDAAKEAIERARLTAALGGSEYSDTVEEGHVIRQDIDAGTTVDEGTTLTYYISKGPESISVPDVTGYTENSALSTLSEAGFVGVVSDSQYSNSVSSGRVISYSPSTARKGDTVYIVVSLGPQPTQQVSVPSVYGMSYSEAASTLANSGLSMSATGDTSGIATSWSPDGRVDEGTTITVNFTSNSSGGGSSGGSGGTDTGGTDTGGTDTGGTGTDTGGTDTDTGGTDTGGETPEN